MRPEKIVTWILSLAFLAILSGLAFCFLFLNPAYALMITLGAAFLAYGISYVVTQSAIVSAIPLTILSILVPAISYVSMKNGAETCEVIGRYRGSFSKGQPRGYGPERVELMCTEGVFERKIRTASRYDLNIGEKLPVLESFTGFKRI